MGTPGYMSPEQVLGGQADERSDIFAFGILLYELLVGVHPFTRASQSGTMSAILREPPAPVSQYAKDAPEAARITLDRLLAKEPQDRYQSFGELRTDLGQLLRDASGLAPVPQTAPSTPTSTDRRTPFVGRESERAEARRLLDQAVSGHGGVLLLGGEPGVGKTRLAEEVLGEARQRGCLALTGRCYETEGTPPFIPWVEIVERAASIVPNAAFREALGDAAPEIAKLVPELRQIFPDIPEPIELPSEQQRRYLFNNFVSFVKRGTRVTPQAVLIDDLHWADDSTLLLLQHVVQHTSEMPLLIVGTYRDVDLDVARPFAEMLETLTRQRMAQEMALGRLSEQAVGDMLDALSGQAPPSPVMTAIYAETEGNPFFTEEVFHHLSEEGRLLDDDGRWRTDLHLADLEVPKGVRLVIGRRVKRLSDEARRVLTTAAVSGRSFDLALLEALGDAKGDALLTALEEAEAAKLIQPVSSGREVRWEFAHGLIRQTLASGQSLPRRQRAHLRVAEAMERVYGAGVDRHASDLAHHLFQAGATADPAKTVRFLTLAGDRARAIYANDDAIRHYECALRTLSAYASREVDRRLVQERLGDLCGLIGQRETALAHYEEVVRAYETVGDGPGEARMQRKIGGLHWDAGDRDRALACFEIGLARLDGHDEHIELARLYEDMGRIAFRGGDNARAVEWAARALAQAEHLAAHVDEPLAPSDPETRQDIATALSHAWNTRGVALARMGRLDEAVACIERSGTVAQTAGLLQVACRSYANLGVLYSDIDPGRAIDTCLHGMEVAKKIGDVGFQSRLYANLAVAYCTLTNRCDEEGIGAAQAAIDLDRRLGRLDHLAVPLIVLEVRPETPFLTRPDEQFVGSGSDRHR